VVDRFTGNWNLNINFTEWLNLSYRAGTDFYTRQYQSVNSDLLLNMRKDFGEAIKTSLTLGQNMYQYTSRGTTGWANGLEIPYFYQLSNTSSQGTRNWTTEYRTAAVFADFGLQVKNMLFINITGRNDWSTTMPADNTSDFYPSFSGGFVFTELPMLQNNSILPFGKIRASYAVTANIAGAYNTLTYYGTAGPGDGWTDGLNFPLMGYSGFTLSGGLGNSSLVHEHMSTFEAGFDLRFYNNRFGIDFGYFNNENSDLLLSVPIASSTGYSSLYQNAATMTSKGIEIMANVVPVQTSAFTWDITGNFTKYTNVVDELAPGVDNVFLGGFTDPQIRAVAGEEYPTIYGYDYWRDDAGNMVINDDPADAYPDGFPMGNYILVPIGPVNPEWVAAFTNTFSFKGLTVSGLLEIRNGGMMWNGTRGATRYFGAHADTETRDETDFVFEGVNGHLITDADGMEIVESDGSTNTQEVQKDVYWYALGEGSGFTGPTMTIEDTDWVRLREMMISYKLPQSMLNNIFISNVEVYFMGRNLFLSTAYEGIDPETNMQGSSNSQGMDYFNMPGTKSYSFGLRLGF